MYLITFIRIKKIEKIKYFKYNIYNYYILLYTIKMFVINEPSNPDNNENNYLLLKKKIINFKLDLSDFKLSDETLSNLKKMKELINDYPKNKNIFSVDNIYVSKNTDKLIIKKLSEIFNLDEKKILN